MKLYLLFDGMDAVIIGIYTSHELASTRRDEQIACHKAQGNDKRWMDWSEYKIEIVEVVADRDISW